MKALEINLCQAITIKELFRLDGALEIEESTTLHPQDLEGLVNLRALSLGDSSSSGNRTNLQYQNFQDTPNLVYLGIANPVNYKHLELGHLKKLQSLAIATENAECTLLKKGYIKQLIGGLENLRQVYFRGNLYMTHSEQDRDSVERQIQTEVLRVTDSPLERDAIRISIELKVLENYTNREDYPNIPLCSDGH